MRASLSSRRQAAEGDLRRDRRTFTSPITSLTVCGMGRQYPASGAGAPRTQNRPGCPSSAGGHQAEVAVGAGGGHPAARGALEQPLLEQVRLVDVLDRVGRLPHAVGQRAEADRPALEGLGTGGAGSAGPAPRGRASSTSSRSRASSATARSTTGRPRTWATSRTRRSRRLAMRGVPRERPASASAASGSIAIVQQAGRAPHDRRQVVGAVVVEAVEHAEAGAQRRGQQAGARGRARPG